MLVGDSGRKHIYLPCSPVKINVYSKVCSFYTGKYVIIIIGICKKVLKLWFEYTEYLIIFSTPLFLYYSELDGPSWLLISSLCVY